MCAVMTVLDIYLQKDYNTSGVKHRRCTLRFKVAKHCNRLKSLEFLQFFLKSYTPELPEIDN